MTKLLGGAVAASVALIFATSAGAESSTQPTTPPLSTTATTAVVTGAADTTTTTPATTTTQPDQPTAVSATLKLKVSGTFRTGKSTVVISGGRIKVSGTIDTYIANQKVIVRVYRGRHKLFARRVLIRDAGDGTGKFSVRYRTSGHGVITVKATHRATEQLKTLKAKQQHLRVLRSRLSSGMKGFEVKLLQSRLAKLHYAVSRSGHYDGGTSRAVLAYRKVNGMARIMTVDKRIFRRLLAGRGAFKPKYPNVSGKHVEADISRQVMALIVGGKVYRTYHISSGAPATPTVHGTFHFYMKTPGTNAKGMVYSSYFIRGYAIHGFSSVPTYNASHGCLRVPIPNAISIYNWIPIGARIDVYA